MYFGFQKQTPNFVANKLPLLYLPLPEVPPLLKIRKQTITESNREVTIHTRACCTFTLPASRIHCNLRDVNSNV